MILKVFRLDGSTVSDRLCFYATQDQFELKYITFELISARIVQNETEIDSSLSLFVLCFDGIVAFRLSKVSLIPEWEASLENNTFDLKLLEQKL